MRNELQSPLPASNRNQKRPATGKPIHGSRQIYSDLQKDAALENYLSHPSMSIAAAAREAGMSQSTLAHWKIMKEARKASQKTGKRWHPKKNIQYVLRPTGNGIAHRPEQIDFTVTMKPEELKPRSQKPVQPVRPTALGQLTRAEMQSLQRDIRESQGENGEKSKQVKSVLRVLTLEA